MSKLVILPEEVVVKLLSAHSEIQRHFQDQTVGIHLNRSKVILSEMQAVLYVGCSLSTIQKHRKAKLVEHIKRGRRIFYTEEALNRYLEYTTINITKAH